MTDLEHKLHQRVDPAVQLTDERRDLLFQKVLEKADQPTPVTPTVSAWKMPWFKFALGGLSMAVVVVLAMNFNQSNDAPTTLTQNNQNQINTTPVAVATFDRSSYPGFFELTCEGCGGGMFLDFKKWNFNTDLTLNTESIEATVYNATPITAENKQFIQTALYPEAEAIPIEESCTELARNQVVPACVGIDDYGRVSVTYQPNVAPTLTDIMQRIATINNEPVEALNFKEITHPGETPTGFTEFVVITSSQELADGVWPDLGWIILLKNNQTVLIYGLAHPATTLGDNLNLISPAAAYDRLLNGLSESVGETLAMGGLEYLDQGFPYLPGTADYKRLIDPTKSWTTINDLVSRPVIQITKLELRYELAEHLTNGTLQLLPYYYAQGLEQTEQLPFEALIDPTEKGQQMQEFRVFSTLKPSPVAL